MHKVLVNRLGGLSLPRKSVVRLTDRPDMTLDVYRGRKTTIQKQQLSATEMHNLVFCVTEHFACSYYCQAIINQCQIITFLILKSDNMAKLRIELKSIHLPISTL